MGITGFLLEQTFLVKPALKEINLGLWDGLCSTLLRTRDPRFNPQNGKVGEGEEDFFWFNGVLFLLGI